MKVLQTTMAKRRGRKFLPAVRRFVRRFVVLVALSNFAAVGLVMGLPTAVANGEAVPVLSDLSIDAEIARTDGRVIVLLFELPNCEWCDYVLEHELRPTARGRVYGDKVLIRRADMLDRSTVINFGGAPTTATEIADRYGAELSPTVVFLDADGAVVADPIIGVTSRDFYGYYLDKALDRALSNAVLN